MDLNSCTILKKNKKATVDRIFSSLQRVRNWTWSEYQEFTEEIIDYYTTTGEFSRLQTYRHFFKNWKRDTKCPPQSTIINIIKRYESRGIKFEEPQHLPLLRGGKMPTKINEESILKYEELSRKNPKITLREAAETLKMSESSTGKIKKYLRIREAGEVSEPDTESESDTDYSATRTRTPKRKRSSRIATNKNKKLVKRVNRNSDTKQLESSTDDKNENEPALSTEEKNLRAYDELMQKKPTLSLVKVASFLKLSVPTVFNLKKRLSMRNKRKETEVQVNAPALVDDQTQPPSDPLESEFIPDSNSVASDNDDDLDWLDNSSETENNRTKNQVRPEQTGGTSVSKQQSFKRKDDNQTEQEPPLSSSSTAALKRGHCFVCLKPFNYEEDDTGKEQQFDTAFVLRKVFCLSDAEMICLMKSAEEGSLSLNPKDWIRFCKDCNDWVKEVVLIHREMQKLLDDFRRCSRVLVKKTRNSWRVKNPAGVSEGEESDLHMAHKVYSIIRSARPQPHQNPYKDPVRRLGRKRAKTKFHPLVEEAIQNAMVELQMSKKKVSVIQDGTDQSHPTETKYEVSTSSTSQEPIIPSAMKSDPPGVQSSYMEDMFGGPPSVEDYHHEADDDEYVIPENSADEQPPEIIKNDDPSPSTSSNTPKTELHKPGTLKQMESGSSASSSAQIPVFHYQKPKIPEESIVDVVCDLCGIKMKNTDLPTHNLKRHDIIMEGYAVLRCPHEGCNYATLYEKNLVSHSFRHSKAAQDKMFCCEICGKSYQQKYGLKKHMEVHENEGKKPFMCDLCGEFYKTRTYLREHVRLYHIEDPNRIPNRNRLKKCGPPTQVKSKKHYAKVDPKSLDFKFRLI